MSYGVGCRCSLDPEFVAVAEASSCSSNSTPSLGMSMCQGCGSKKKKKKKKRKKKKKKKREREREQRSGDEEMSVADSDKSSVDLNLMKTSWMVVRSMYRNLLVWNLLLLFLITSVGLKVEELEQVEKKMSVTMMKIWCMVSYMEGLYLKLTQIKVLVSLSWKSI